jgi:hypothetical protein
MFLLRNRAFQFTSGEIAISYPHRGWVHFRNNRFLNPEAAARKCLRPFAVRVDQVRKNANQTPPRITTARQVLMTKSTKTEGPGSAWRASVGVSMIIPCFLMGIKLSESNSVQRSI